MTNYSKLIKEYAENTGKTYKEIFMELCTKSGRDPQRIGEAFQMLDTIGEEFDQKDYMRDLMKAGLLSDIINRDELEARK